jgi:hypothetical protein
VSIQGVVFTGYKKDKDKLKLEVLISKLKKNTYTDKLKSITHFYNIDFEELIKKYDSEDTYLYLEFHHMLDLTTLKVMMILEDCFGMVLMMKEFLDQLRIEDY